MAGNTQLNQAGAPVSFLNPLPVTVAPPKAGDATAGTAAAIAAVDAAPDKVDTFAYLDAGTADERIGTIVHSSSALGLSYTETFAYAGSAGSYRISSITKS